MEDGRGAAPTLGGLITGTYRTSIYVTIDNGQHNVQYDAVAHCNRRALQGRLRINHGVCYLLASAMSFIAHSRLLTAV